MNWLAEKFELTRDGGGHNVRPMEGMRGLAVFLVFLVHYATLIKPWIATPSTLATVASMVHSIGNTGVDLFFVLSGFLIYGTLISRPQRFSSFMWRRIRRIYPTFIAVFIVYTALSFIFSAENKIPHSISEGLLYLAANFLLLPGLFPIEPMITVSWSLSYEMFYYLAIPLVVMLFGLRMRSRSIRVAFFMPLAIAFAGFSMFYGGPLRMIMFISGILLYEALGSSSIRTPPPVVGFVALVLGLASALLPIEGSQGFAVKISCLFVTFLVVGLACFRDPLNWLSRGFSLTPLRWLGNMSYSYYLLHGLALKAIFMLVTKVVPISGQGAGMFLLLISPVFLLTLIPAAVLFLVVERPFSLAAPKANPHRTKPVATVLET